MGSFQAWVQMWGFWRSTTGGYWVTLQSVCCFSFCGSQVEALRYVGLATGGHLPAGLGVIPGPPRHPCVWVRGGGVSRGWKHWGGPRRPLCPTHPQESPPAPSLLRPQGSSEQGEGGVVGRGSRRPWEGRCRGAGLGLPEFLSASLRALQAPLRGPQAADTESVYVTGLQQCSSSPPAPPGAPPHFLLVRKPEMAT